MNELIDMLMNVLAKSGASKGAQLEALSEAKYLMSCQILDEYFENNPEAKRSNADKD